MQSQQWFIWKKSVSERINSPSNGLSASPNMLHDSLEMLKSKISLVSSLHSLSRSILHAFLSFSIKFVVYWCLNLYASVKKNLKQLQNTQSGKEISSDQFISSFILLQSSTSFTYSRAYFEYLKENHSRSLKILTNNQQTNQTLLQSNFFSLLLQ